MRLLSILVLLSASYKYSPPLLLAVEAFDVLSSSRRSFLETSTLLTTTSADLLQPPPTAPLRPGGFARYNPLVVSGDDRWKPELSSNLAKSRILANELSPLQQSPFDFNQELYYPAWMFGEWNCTAVLKQKVYPYGTDYLPNQSLLEGSPRNRQEQPGNDSCTTYSLRYFSTLANTLQNQLTVNLGTGVPATKIIQDRAYNAVSISKAYRQLAPVAAVDWDYRNEPTRAVLRFNAGMLTDDLMPLGPRRTEIFWNARTSSEEEVIANDAAAAAAAAAAAIFACAERSRAVTLSSGAAVAADTETITEYRLANTNNANHVTATQRIACYLTPNPNSKEGVLWQSVAGKAVAFFDYELDLRRVTEPFVLSDGSVQERACVTTPKDVVQCY